MNYKKIIEDFKTLLDSVESSRGQIENVKAWAERGKECFKNEPDKRAIFEDLLLMLA